MSPFIHGLMTGGGLMISAQNQIKGRITNIKAGEAMSLVTLEGDGCTTNHGVKALGLKQGNTVTAVVKSNEAMLIKDGGQDVKISARNVFNGRVESIDKGEAMGFVKVAAGSVHLGAAITRHALDEM